MTLTLAVLAAGIGSRYGGLKQMDPIGPSGEFIVDYSIYDAIRAGFNKVVFVISPDIEDAFKFTIGARIEKQAQTEYVFQELSTAMPPVFTLPANRKKPWGTGHAVLVCADAIREPFAVINSDDFYGRDSYAVLADFLKETADESHYAMVGFALRNTVPDQGTVARGICSIATNGLLRSITETVGIERTGNEIRCANGALTGNEVASMNLWGFMPSLFGHLKSEWKPFLKRAANDPKAEFMLPTVVDKLVAGKKVSVKALRTSSQWFGMTNPADKEKVVGETMKLIARAEYPSRLWQ
jgi:NDP-sugar pyrophosphorylase family protein